MVTEAQILSRARCRLRRFLDDALNAVLQGHEGVRLDEPAVFALFDLHFGAAAAGGKLSFPLHKCFGDG